MCWPEVVDAGASVSFMHTTTREELTAFWACIADEVRARTTRAKLLVHPSARRRGLASALMATLETMAREERRTLLTLDTVTGGDAERLYSRLGWIGVGVIPRYALFPDRKLCDTTVFFKRLP